MLTNKNSISAWQTGILIFFLFFANKILVLPSLFVEQAGILSFILPIFMFLFEFGLLFLFFKVKKRFPTQTFREIVETMLGKFCFYFLSTLIMLFFLGKAILLYDVTYVFFTKTVYQDGTNLMFLFCFIPIMIHLALSNLRAVGRTAQLFFPLVVLIVLFCLVVGVFGIESFPLFSGFSAKQMAMCALRHSMVFGDSMFLFVIIDKINIKKGQWKILFSLATASAVCVCLIFLVFVLLFTYTSFMHPFALFEIISYIKEVGGVGRIDIISMIVIVILTYFHLGIFLISFKESFVSMFKIDAKYSIVLFFAIFLVVIEYLIVNLQKAIFFGEHFWPFFNGVSYGVLPLFFIICLIKSKRRKIE